MSGSVPYLGSKISLVSRSQIRYEGILYTIDTGDSTVALAKVKSFGTEDRPTDKPVPPRDEVYEYIIFRSSDIKDLHVCEGPKPQPTLTSGLPHDPAIVQHSALVKTPAHMPKTVFTKSVPESTYSTAVTSDPTFHQHQQLPWTSNSSAGHASSLHSDSRSGTPTSRKSPTTDAGVQASYDSHREAPTRRGRGGAYRQPSTQQSNKAVTEDKNQAQRRQPPMRRGRGSGGPRRGRGQRGRPGQSPLKFDNDFDFEQANAEFLELENKLSKTTISDPVTTVVNGEESSSSSTTTTTMPEEPSKEPAQVEPNEEDDLLAPFYDKAKSFFDNISCEALERSKGNMHKTDWKQERKLNTETFGVAGTYNRRGWHGGRGYRGYRGYRGGRGYYRQPSRPMQQRSSAASS